MSWVRDVLTGAESVDFGRHTRDEYHWLSNQQHKGDESVQKLNEGFAELISDPKRRLRGAAICWFAGQRAPGVGPMLVAAWLSNPALYKGVRQDWLPNDHDLGRLMMKAIAKNALDVPGALDLIRNHALTPKQGNDVLASLIHSDPIWVRNNLKAIVTNTPATVELIFFHLHLLQVDMSSVANQIAIEAPEIARVLIQVMLSHNKDIAEILDVLKGSLSTPTLHKILVETVPEGDERVRYLEIL